LVVRSRKRERESGGVGGEGDVSTEGSVSPRKEKRSAGRGIILPFRKD